MISDDRLLEFWEIEQNSPQWFKTSSELWWRTKDVFLEFCRGYHRIYDLENALLYVEGLGDKAEMHFSAQRGACIDIDKLQDIRGELLTDFDLLFGWILKQNRGLKRICAATDMKFHGVRMFHGESHGKLLEWHCHSVSKNSLLIP